MEKTRVILASSSPRRKSILSEFFSHFDVIPVEIDESPLDNEQHGETASRLALEKARTAAEKHPASLVIGADTLVFLDGEIMGKACSEEEAHAMLTALSGKAHEVVTGVAFVLKNENLEQSVSCRSEVVFKDISKNEIGEYLKGGEYKGKAGAYAIQGAGGALIKSFCGSFTGIVGLPVREIIKFIMEFGLKRLPLKDG